jgi:hypothetical protein
MAEGDNVVIRMHLISFDFKEASCFCRTCSAAICGDICGDLREKTPAHLTGRNIGCLKKKIIFYFAALLLQKDIQHR